MTRYWRRPAARAIRPGRRKGGKRAGLRRGRKPGNGWKRWSPSWPNWLAPQELAARYEEDIVELALAVAARIVRKESSLGADTVRELLRETLPRMGGAGKITITVHPDDMAAIEQDARQLASLARRAGRRDVGAPTRPSREAGAWSKRDREARRFG